MFGRKKKNKFTTEYLESLNETNANLSTGTQKSEERSEEVRLPDSEELEKSMETEQIETKTLEQKRDAVISSCEHIVEAGRRMDELKVEYQAVNQYIDDITRIENLPDKEASEVLEYAKRVVVLEKDRKDFGRSMSKLTNRQYSHIREIEPDIKKILTNMNEDEKYCETVKLDMRYLEGERATQWMEIRDMKERLYLIRGSSIIAMIAFGALFILLMTLALGYGKDISGWLYGIVFFAAIYVFGAFTIHRNALYRIQVAELKLNRAITLLNKIKIKYVNVVSRLEYTYEKHGVKSSYQLNRVWGTYLKLKKEHEVYNKASNRLLEAEEGLVDLLSNMGVKDAGIWVNQAYAIIDPREMGELKTSLNHRRYKLKQSLEYNQETVLRAQEDIRTIVLGDKAHAKELMAIVDGYDF